MRWLILLLISTNSWASTLKIAVVDTGLDLTDSRFSQHLCSTGHKSFTFDGNSQQLADINGHGTHVTGLIQKYAGRGDYCLLIYKYYSDFQTGQQNLQAELNAFKAAVEAGASIINFSGGGPERNNQECEIIRSHPQVTFVVAAGNENLDLDKASGSVGYWPAMCFLPNEIVVGNIDKFGRRSPSSDYGSRVRTQEIGVNVLSTLPRGRVGLMSGTSQSTAIYTGKLIHKILNKNDK